MKEKTPSHGTEGQRSARPIPLPTSGVGLIPVNEGGHTSTQQDLGSGDATGWVPLGLLLVIVAGGLGLFNFFSAGSALANKQWSSKPRVPEAAPPISGLFRPQVTRYVLLAFALACVIIFLSQLSTNEGRRPIVLLTGAVLLMLAFAISVAYIGGASRATYGVKRTPDARVLEKLGVRAFVNEYPSLLARREVTGAHAISHPPGRLVVTDGLIRFFGRNRFLAGSGMAALGCLTLTPLWFFTRRVAGERAASIAVGLFMVAPGPIIYGFASVEAVEMMLVAVAAWLFIEGCSDGKRATSFAFGAGVVLGLTSFLTFIAGVVAVAFALMALLMRGRRPMRPLLAAAIGGVLALVVLRLALGYDLIASYQASKHLLASLPVLQRPYLYWLFAAPIAWLTFAGVPIATLLIRETIRRRPFYILAFVVPLGILYALPQVVTGLVPGELERTALYAVPFAAVAAGAGLSRLRRPWAAPLIAAAALQTILIQSLFFTPY